MTKLLEIKDLSGGYEQKINILEEINLSVDQGEAVGVIGLNGSGKSTLGKAIMHLLPYREGQILFNDEDITLKSAHELAQLGIAMMHQGGLVFPTLSVWQNLSLAGWKKNDDKDYEKQLETIIPLLQKNKRKLEKTMADTLSGGERHELALAMAMARKPKLLVLDEPSAGLSPTSVEATYTLLEKTKNEFGLSILLIEQNIARAVEFCKKCVLLESGRITYQSSTSGVKLSEIEKLLFKN